MRFTIVLALCFIGAASASSLSKRSFIDDFQNNSQNAFHAFEQFGQTFNEKVQEALKNLLSAFGNQNQATEASVNVEKRATNPLVLINDLDDPAKLAQDMLKVLMDLATGQGRRKRATNPLVLINDLSDPAKFAQDFLKVLADMATGQGRRKRDIAEDLKKFSEDAKHNAEEALKKLFSFLEQFKSQSSESTEAPVVVEKRATNPLVLINDLSDPAQFAQDFLKVLADMATGQGRRKRATNPLVLINDLSDPAKFAQDFLKVLADLALAQG